MNNNIHFMHNRMNENMQKLFTHPKVYIIEQ